MEAATAEQLDIDGPNLPKSLDFNKPKFIKGLNFAILIGERWQKAELVGNILPVNDADSNVMVGNCVVSHVMVCCLADVPDFVFTKYHDVACKNKIVCMDTLREEYGESVSGASMVAVIGFEPNINPQP